MAKGKYKEWITPEGLLKIEGWARDGLTDEQIAHNMGITTSTLYEWKKKYSDISDTLKRGKEVIDILVENALLKRALGYGYTEVTEELIPVYVDGCIDHHEMMVTKKVRKEVAPDTTAQIFWLKNRKPTEWRDRREVGVSGEVNNHYQNMSDKDLDEKIAQLTARIGVAHDQN